QLRFQRGVSIAAALAALVMATLGIVAWQQWGEAARERDNARKSEIRVAQEKERADGELKKSQRTQSLFFIEMARQQRAVGDAGTAVLLALDALPDHKAGIARPYLPEAEFVLGGALRNLRERIVLKGHVGRVLNASFSPDGKRIVTASGDGTARLWD